MLIAKIGGTLKIENEGGARFTLTAPRVWQTPSVGV
jgi:hypothetical protein